MVRDAETLESLGGLLAADLRRIQSEIPAPVQPDHSELLRQAVNDLAARRERLIDALEDGSLDAATYAARVQTLEQRIAKARAELDQQEQHILYRAQRLQGLAAVVQAIEAAPDFIIRAEPQLINAALRALISKILVREGGELEIVYR